MSGISQHKYSEYVQIKVYRPSDRKTETHDGRVRPHSPTNGSYAVACYFRDDELTPCRALTFDSVACIKRRIWDRQTDRRQAVDIKINQDGRGQLTL